MAGINSLRRWRSGHSALRRRGSPWWTLAIEATLLILFILQVVHLIWLTLSSPPPPNIGTIHAARLGEQERARLFSTFDPFFPAAAASPAPDALTGVPLALFGLHLDQDPGRASAIIAGPDGVQNSYLVGEEIVPGVILRSVAADHAIIDRNNVAERLEISVQSQTYDSGPEEAAPDISSTGVEKTPPPEELISRQEPPPPISTDKLLKAEALRSGIGLAPRSSDGQVTGILLTARGPAFHAIGLLRGDIVKAVNGQPVTSMTDINILQQSFRPGARIALQIERGASVIPLVIWVPSE